VLFVRKVIYKK